MVWDVLVRPQGCFTFFHWCWEKKPSSAAVLPTRRHQRKENMRNRLLNVSSVLTANELNLHFTSKQSAEAYQDINFVGMRKSKPCPQAQMINKLHEILDLTLTCHVWRHFKYVEVKTDFACQCNPLLPVVSVVSGLTSSHDYLHVPGAATRGRAVLAESSTISCLSEGTDFCFQPSITGK